MSEFVLPKISTTLRYHRKWAKRDLTPFITELLDIWEEYHISGELDVIVQGPALTRFGLRTDDVRSETRALKLKKEYRAVFARNDIKVYSTGERVYIEVPWTVDEIYLGDLLNNRTFQSSGGLPVAIGMDIGREFLLADLTETPNILVAGVPGCGISNFLNGIIMSLLLSHTRDEMELYLFGDRTTNFRLYSPLSHCHVFTEPRYISRVLNQLLLEVENRYNKFSLYGCLNIYEYTEKVGRMPHIFIFIEEYADVLHVSRGVENMLLDLIEVSEDYGIHIITATHHPTSIRPIKDSFSVRACFHVNTVTQSHSVLGRKGAELLFEKYDFLFLDLIGRHIYRLHSALVTPHEIRKVVSALMENEKNALRQTRNENKKATTQTVFEKLFGENTT